MAQPRRPDDEARKGAKAYAALQARSERAWREANPGEDPPECGCGCGGRVAFGGRGPNRFILNHQWKGGRGVDFKNASSAWRQDPCRSIEIEKFRELCRQIKAKKGWGWEEMAIRGGWAPGQLFCYMFDKSGRRKVIGKDTAKGFLDRLAGKATPPTKYQLRQAAIAKRRETKLAKSGDDE